MVTFVIPARGGSKGILNKNLKKVGGTTLVERAIQTALSTGLGNVFVSTDSVEILKIAQQYDVVCFERSDYLSGDTTTATSVVLDVVKSFEFQLNGAVMLLQPTSPLRNAQDLKETVKLLNPGGSVVSVCPVQNVPSLRLISSEGFLKTVVGEFGDKILNAQRQDVEQVFKVNGAVFLTHVGTLINHGTFHTPKSVPYVMPISRSVDIDTQEDLLLAEYLLNG